jgi:hypothetical protein
MRPDTFPVVEHSLLTMISGPNPTRLLADNY